MPACAALASLSCAALALRGAATAPIPLGTAWGEAEPRVAHWAAAARPPERRTYAVRDLDGRADRVYPALDSLILAEVYRRKGIDDPRFRGMPHPPAEAGVPCAERYIFYLRGNRIAGVAYRLIESNGMRGYRQEDDAVGELPFVPPVSG